MSSKPSNKPQTPETCPVCGDDVPPRALACLGCGADHNSGWRVEGADDDFDYNEFVRNEFDSSPRPAGLHPIWWITAILLFVATVITFILTGH